MGGRNFPMSPSLLVDEGLDDVNVQRIFFKLLQYSRLKRDLIAANNDPFAFFLLPWAPTMATPPPHTHTHLFFCIPKHIISNASGLTFPAQSHLTSPKHKTLFSILHFLFDIVLFLLSSTVITFPLGVVVFLLCLSKCSQTLHGDRMSPV